MSRTPHHRGGEPLLVAEQVHKVDRTPVRPAAVDDAYAVLAWTAAHAATLGIDPGWIAVGGHSAGAGLAAAVALRARDQHGPPIRFQLLNQPRAGRPPGDLVGTDLHRHALDDPRQARRHLATLPRRPAGLALFRPRRGPMICPACHRPTSPPRSSTRSATKPSPMGWACCRPACRSSSTSGPASSTAPRRSCPPTSPSAKTPNSPPPCAAPSPAELAATGRSSHATTHSMKNHHRKDTSA
jgi:alpha/beta hydrolase fold